MESKNLGVEMVGLDCCIVSTEGWFELQLHTDLSFKLGNFRIWGLGFELTCATCEPTQQLSVSPRLPVTGPYYQNRL